MAAKTNSINIEIINCKKAELNKRGIRDFSEWIKGPVLYIGRDMTHYIPDAKGSKWGNPFRVNTSQHKETRIDAYENHIRTTPELWNSLEELLNYKELGCWCKPNGCHGDVLLMLLYEKLSSTKA